MHQRKVSTLSKQIQTEKLQFQDSERQSYSSLEPDQLSPLKVSQSQISGHISSEPLLLHNASTNENSGKPLIWNQQSEKKLQKIIFLEKDMINYAPPQLIARSVGGGGMAKKMLDLSKYQIKPKLVQKEGRSQSQFEGGQKNESRFSSLFQKEPSSKEHSHQSSRILIKKNDKLDNDHSAMPPNQQVCMNLRNARSVKALTQSVFPTSEQDSQVLTSQFLRSPQKELKQLEIKFKEVHTGFKKNEEKKKPNNILNNFPNSSTTKVDFYQKYNSMNFSSNPQQTSKLSSMQILSMPELPPIEIIPQNFRQIVILHLNQQKTHFVQVMPYKIPIQNQNEPDRLLEKEDSHLKELETLMASCQKFFNLSYSLRFLSLLDESPIQYLRDIPQTERIVIISHHPKVNFWLRVFEQKQMIKPSEKEFTQVIQRLQDIQDLSEIENYFMHRKSFLTGSEEISTNNTAIENRFPSVITSRKKLDQTPITSSHDISNNNIYSSSIRNNQLGQQKLEPLILNSDRYQKGKPSSFQNISLERGTTSLKQIPNIQGDSSLRKTSRKTFIEDDFSMSSTKGLHQTNQAQIIFNQKKKEQPKLGFKVEQNIRKYTSLSSVMRKKYPALNEAADVNSIIQKTSFNRYQLHFLFSKFKALIEYKAKYRNPLKKPHGQIIDEGVDVISFRRGVESLLVAPTEQIEKLFQSQNAFVTKDQGGMNWQGFIYALDMIEAKTDNAKIDLFMRLLDEDLSGTISYGEIFDQSNQLLRQLYQGQQIKGISLDDISHFLTKTIFDAVGQDYDKEILTEDLKLQIRKKNKDLELLLMLCFYNNEQPYNYYSNSDEEELVQEDKKAKEGAFK